MISKHKSCIFPNIFLLGNIEGIMVGFSDFMQSIFDKKDGIVGTSTKDDLIEIFKEKLN